MESNYKYSRHLGLDASRAVPALETNVTSRISEHRIHAMTKSMKMACVAVLLLVISSGTCLSQQPSAFHDDLLDHLAGTWVLQGTIMGKPATHEVTAEWVLGNQYLRFHEVSREKQGDHPQYEAMVFIGWDPKTGEYVCVWLDDFGFAYDNAIGRAKRNGNEIPFLFQYPDGPFHTTFAYAPGSGSWEMRMDNEQEGKLKPFARTKLTRK